MVNEECWWENHSDHQYAIEYVFDGPPLVIIPVTRHIELAPLQGCIRCLQPTFAGPLHHCFRVDRQVILKLVQATNLLPGAGSRTATLALPDFKYPRSIVVDLLRYPSQLVLPHHLRPHQNIISHAVVRVGESGTQVCLHNCLTYTFWARIPKQRKEITLRWS